MAVQKLASMIVPTPCNAAQEQRNWQALSTILNILDQIIEINIDETTNEITYDLVNLTNVYTTNIDVSNVANITTIYATDITVYDSLNVSNLTATTINVTTINATTINVAYIDAYSVTYIILYDEVTQVCPPPCGEGSSGSGSGAGEGGGTSNGSCSLCNEIETMPSTVYLVVEWPEGNPETITMNLYEEHDSAEDPPTFGYCYKKYSGSGPFGAGNQSSDYRLWVQRGCEYDTAVRIWLDTKRCGADYAGSADDPLTWERELSDASDSPLYGTANNSGQLNCAPTEPYASESCFYSVHE